MTSDRMLRKMYTTPITMAADIANRVGSALALSERRLQRGADRGDVRTQIAPLNFIQHGHADSSLQR